LSDKIIKTLSGFSGADIFLVSNGKNKFVRKIAKSEDDIKRLIIQANKQSNFPNIFKTPKILDIKNNYVDMEYIAGCDAAKYLSSANYKQVNNFCQNILIYINYLHSNENSELFFPLDKIKEKIREINKKVPIPDILEKIEKFNSNITLNSTLNHGDLTLENMIVDKNGNIYLIDFLNSQIDHYWQDISKLYQDLVGGWYLRRRFNIAKCNTDFLAAQIYNLTINLNTNYKNFHNLLILYNFLRILPYAKNKEDKDFVMKRVVFFSHLL
jgi:RIO-like serine/threonine protein kinase